MSWSAEEGNVFPGLQLRKWSQGVLGPDGRTCARPDRMDRLVQKSGHGPGNPKKYTAGFLTGVPGLCRKRPRKVAAKKAWDSLLTDPLRR